MKKATEEPFYETVLIHHGKLHPSQRLNITKAQQGLPRDVLMPPLNQAGGKIVSRLIQKLELLAIKLCDITLTTRMVETVLKALETSKTPAPDEMNPGLLQNCTEELFTDCKTHGMWLSSWKTGHITPIHRSAENGGEEL